MCIVYSRSSTATQSLLRQRHILTEAGLLVRAEGVAAGFHPAEGVLLFEDPATTSKIPALERPAFARVAAAAHPGDTLTVSELFRLCRDLVDIHAVRGWCQARGVVLRVLSGPLSNFHDLAAGDATTDLIINVITAVGVPPEYGGNGPRRDVDRAEPWLCPVNRTTSPQVDASAAMRSAIRPQAGYGHPQPKPQPSASPSGLRIRATAVRFCRIPVAPLQRPDAPRPAP
ncbi:recombinase family protein [Streptosporangium sp. G11]|uniref:recombinase family protein n=1 Tax=Streptosporangium sp. G11 TaxID=3436926 RepID=UPI003EC0FD4B